MTIRWWARATIDAFGASDLDDDVLAVAELDDLDAEITATGVRWRDAQTGAVRANLRSREPATTR